MVVEMLKYSFLVYHKERDAFLEELRNIGAVHIIEKDAAAIKENEALQQIVSKEDSLTKVIRALTSATQGKELAATIGNYDLDSTLIAYDRLIEEKNALIQEQAILQKEISATQIWGDFDPLNIEKLAKAGYKIQFFSCTARNFNAAWADTYNATVIGTQGSSLYFITITPAEQAVEIEMAEKLKMPKDSLSQLNIKADTNEAKAIKIEESIATFAHKHLKFLQEQAKALRETFEFRSAQINSEAHADEKIILIEGWLPVTKKEKLEQFLDSKGIYYQSQKPTEEENVPVLLKNNAFTRLFELIGELYDMPNYHEMDLTPFFAPFFVMFFGLCLGDAGYGLLILVAAFIARFKVKPSLKPVMTLAMILGSGTVLFGTISGTLFGIPLLDVDWAWIKSLKAFMLNTDQLFNLALIIGACQIIFGMTLRAIGSTKRYGFLRSLSYWGWLLLIVGCGATFALNMMGVIHGATTRLTYYIILGISALGIFVLNNIKRNPIINVGAGIWDTYNMATGLMGDLLSYIRLFALGISGSVMGLVFNDLAFKMSGDIPVISQLIMLVILLFGHGLNIFMNGLGAFVHPMRLTFVEFYKNAGFEGGGKKYHPFKKTDE